MAGDGVSDVNELSFEAALDELENLTADMATGTATLRESVLAYERGTALLKRCRAELLEAHATIERLRAEGEAEHLSETDNGDAS